MTQTNGSFNGEPIRRWIAWKPSSDAFWRKFVSRTLLLPLLLMIGGQWALAQSNPIVVENQKAGNPRSEWDITGAGDPSIQGFATDISVNRGSRVRFKIKTAASAYRIDIYRLGYYAGLGARKVATVTPSASLPQNQPDPITNSATGLVDCGNWAESGSWQVPSDATSGVYIAKLVRSDTGGESHIAFIVRDDSSTSDLLFQTSDTTWQAYNSYGGNSLYVGSPAGRAYKVSYNRPFNTRAGETSYDWLFSAEYPMIRWLEANGYDVSYSSGVDTDRRGNLLTNHRVFLSVGHDEYWSGAQRANVEAARNAGVHLAFFSGNEVFWKTRWENSIGGPSTSYRTLVCYKETHAGAKIDPNSAWTGTWRDPRFSPPADGGRPENSLTGTIFMVNALRNDPIEVPAEYGKHRFWRNTSVATLNPGQRAVFPAGTLGYEWDACPNNGAQPTGLMRLSLKTVSNVSLLQDYGSTYASGQATHSLSLYRHSSGALVFGAGTVQWSWGLDAVHDNGSQAADNRMRQATVNLFADMGVQPGSLQSGLVPASASTDTAAPTSSIQSPASGATIPVGGPVVISGTATDAGGVAWGVEVSTDGGATWNPAIGGENWTYSWTPLGAGSVTIKTRAFDDSGNMETPSAGRTVAVGGGGTGGALTTIWPNNAVPGRVDGGADSPVEVGVKFRSDVAGTIHGIRFYKASTNTGTHVGNLWTSNGTRLATATFTNETASGWQQVNFATPVPITANTVYVASYHVNGGHYSADISYFASRGVDNPPLHALANGVSGGNGVYAYGTNSVFPTRTWNTANYWVDVVFQAAGSGGPTLTTIAVTPANPSVLTGATQQFTATGTYSDGSTANLTSQVTWTSLTSAVATINSAGLATAQSVGSTTIRAALGSVNGSATLTVQASPLSITTASLPGGAVNSAYSASLAAAGGTPPYTWSVASGALPAGVTLNGSTGALSGTPTASGTFNFTVRATDSAGTAQTVTKAFSITITSGGVGGAVVSIWPATAVPGTVDGGADNPVELGVKFRSDVDGTINGIRFYKASANTGTHVGNLWTSNGTRLATATFTNETASGWQQVNFATPVPISANTVYVASYHVNGGHYSEDLSYFTSSGVDNAPLHALADGVSGANGVYAYGATSVFPTRTWFNANYWVDVVFQPNQTATGALLTIASTPEEGKDEVGPILMAAAKFSGEKAESDGDSIAMTALSDEPVTDAEPLPAVAAAGAISTIWPSTVAPANVDGGGDKPVAVGVRFRSDVAGTINGIRFYKANANTGTHVGNLWTTNGTRLATATFTNETASGWQQVNFATPVPITANTVYVASYHTTVGHYSEDATYFANGNVNNPPLHALASSGVHAYGASNVFPDKTWRSVNYWVDVVFEAASAGEATLNTIAVTPANPSILPGSTQQFTATGTYSDGSTANLTTQVTWTSLATTVATINSAGLATAQLTGSATIRAALGSVSGSATLTVQAAPLSITTASLPGGAVNTAYSGSLAAVGGTPPYTWSLASGSLPAGVSLNADSGALSGIPTASGTSNFTIRATDSAGTPQTVTKALSVVVAGSGSGGGTFATIWPATAVPGRVDNGPDSPAELGVKFRSDVAGTIHGIRFYKASANTGTHIGNIWTINGTRLATATFTNETASGWQQVNFATPVPIAANTVYVASYHANGGHFSADSSYFAAGGVDNPPLHALANGVSGGNGVFAYAAESVFPTQTWNTANYWVDVVFQAAGSGGPTLTTIAVTPASPSVVTGATQQFTATGTYSDGSTANLTSQVTWTSLTSAVATINSAGLATAQSVGSTTIRAALGSVNGSATLTVQASPLSITTASLPGGAVNSAYSASLAAAGGTPPYTWSVASGALPAGVTLNGSTGALSGTPTASGTFNFTVRATDSAGTAQTVTKAFSITITSVGGGGTVVSIWPATAVPGTVDGGADNPVELGVKFRSDVAGTINGIRFYKASANTGTHVGNLWTSSGTRLATATFTNETASGWQQVNFATPVPIDANTVYVASYHVTGGHYSVNSSYFASSGVDNPPLHALANGVLGGNGVFAYGASSVFPTQTWNTANYWVDVAFQPSGSTGDAPPTVVATTPAAGTNGVSVSTAVTVKFSEAMTASTINATTITVRDGANSPVAATVAYNAASTTATVSISGGLRAASKYAVTVKGGASGVKDSTGNPLSADFVWSFQTITYGAEGGGPGGPILVLKSSANPFSQYYAEILLSEGLNQFAIQDIADVTSSSLAAFDVVILGEMTLTTAQVTMLSNWVTAGGNLIAMRPDKKLASLLGLVDANSTLSEGYLLVNTANGPGVGIVDQTIQFHGTADRYTLGSASSLANLYSNAQTATLNPAVTLRSVGSNGGQAAAFTFDLARSIVYTRQGNPAWSGQERDGIAPIRSSDLFFGAASGNVQPDWVNLNKVAIPQADEQQRLLANMILSMNSDRKLLPRFWYFPNGHEAAIVMTGDDHATGGTAGRFEQYIAESPANGSTDDWETIRSSSYIFPDSPLTNAQAVAYNAAGFDIGLHVNTGVANFTRQTLDAFFATQLNQFRARYPGLPQPTTLRTHAIVWSDYTTSAEVSLQHGVRLDVNYYYFPGSWVANRPGLFTGSGVPMRFATAAGEVLDIYQAATQMTDESDQSYPFTVDALLDKALGPEGYYGAFVANMHTDTVASAGSDAIVDSAKARGVPVISARQLLNWLDGRHSSSIGSIQWSNNKLAFSVTANDAARGLQGMVPVPVGRQIGSLKFNGAEIPFYGRVVKGVNYAFFDAVSGSYEATFLADTVAPTVALVLPENNEASVPHDVQVNVVFSEAIDISRLGSGNFVLRDAANNVVSAAISYAANTNTAQLIPNSLLSSGTTYTVVVKGGANGVTDVSGNPLANDFVSSFTTQSAPATVSLWSDSSAPSVPSVADAQPVELGMKFRSTVKGRILGIRFFKGPSNTGTHVGRLWSAAGASLGAVTFQNETASGWQYQAFATPISINANTTYVASYHTTSGFYSATSAYFAGAGYTNGPLTAIENAAASGNGVYRYGASGFPDQTFNATNYWVDVVFEPQP